ncbi:UNVERIFIED_CONTAM: hypothetical protein NCL1_63440 [Trichonephila clavipes]
MFRVPGKIVPALRLAKLDVSSAVIRGEPAWLNCSYTLEGDELYSVKWYKNNVEFYRFLPTDRPPGQKYDLQGVYVDVSRFFSSLKWLYKISRKIFHPYCVCLYANISINALIICG